MSDTPTPHTDLGPGGEFDLVRRLVARLGARAAGVGDDCAVIAPPAGEQLVVSTDASVENVHFRKDWLSPREIGWRATAAALSDLAAMGARPLGVLVALALPERWRESFDELAEGIGESVAAAGTQVIGGDTSAADELALTVTVLGSAARPLLRSGGRPGDRVYVTGRIGGPIAALRSLRAGKEPRPEARHRFARPEPRLREGQWLAEQGASAAIDISDGLAADLGHLAAASGLRLVVELERLAIHEEDARTGAWATVDRPPPSHAQLLDAARSGEEYELVVLSSSSLDVRRFEQAFRLPLREIGRAEAVEAGASPGVTLLARGARVDLPGGHDHFSR